MSAFDTVTRTAMVLVVVLLVAIYLVAFSVPKMRQRRHFEARIKEKEAETRLLSARLERLRNNQKALEDDPAFLERIAREELGYAFTNETVFRFEEPD